MYFRVFQCFSGSSGCVSVFQGRRQCLSEVLSEFCSEKRDSQGFYDPVVIMHPHTRFYNHRSYGTNILQPPRIGTDGQMVMVNHLCPQPLLGGGVKGIAKRID